MKPKPISKEEHKHRATYFMTLSVMFLSLAVLFIVGYIKWWATIPICISLGIAFKYAAKYEKAGISL